MAAIAQFRGGRPKGIFSARRSLGLVGGTWYFIRNWFDKSLHHRLSCRLVSLFVHRLSIHLHQLFINTPIDQSQPRFLRVLLLFLDSVSVVAWLAG